MPVPRLWAAFLSSVAISGPSPSRSSPALTPMWAGRSPTRASPSLGQGKHIVFLSGDEEYRSEEGLPMLAKILSQRHGFKCTVLFAIDADGMIDPNNTKSLPGAEALDSADAIVMLTRPRVWPDEPMKHFVAACEPRHPDHRLAHQHPRLQLSRRSIEPATTRASTASR